MVTEPARTETLEAGRTLLADPVASGSDLLVVPVTERVPAWLGELITDAHAAGRRVAVSAEPRVVRDGDGLAGWEIGVATVALAAGADEVFGVDAGRVRRVRVVVEAMAAGRAPAAGPTDVVAP